MMNKKIHIFLLACILAVASLPAAADSAFVFQAGPKKPFDSELKVKVGDLAPDFELPSIDGNKVRLPDFRGKNNVILTFVPAAWTPVCSGQWPGYNIAKDLFEQSDAVMLGITVDNVPTLASWVHAMGGVNFSVLSDFWPHGKTASEYGILRSDGVSERAIFIIDKNGHIAYAKVTDINVRPELGEIVKALQKIHTQQP